MASMLAVQMGQKLATKLVESKVDSKVEKRELQKVMRKVDEMVTKLVVLRDPLLADWTALMKGILHTSIINLKYRYEYIT